jgi:hypothetical protein
MKIQKGWVMTIALTAALGALTACTAETSIPEGTEPSVASTQPAADAEVTAPVEPATPAVGATVAAEDEIAAAEAAGLGVYTTSAGAQVVIDPAAPAPQVMLDDARATGAGGIAPADKAASQAQATALLAAGDRADDAGKPLVYVLAVGQYLEDGTLEKTRYSAMPGSITERQYGGIFDALDEAIAQANTAASVTGAEVIVLI